MQSTNKIKVVYIIPTLDYGGAERQLIKLCLNIDKSTFDVTIVLLYDRDKLLREAYSDIAQVTTIKMKRRRRYSVFRLFELRRLLRALMPDIVHTFLPTANFWGCLAARLFSRAKIVASSRGMHYRRTNKWYHVNFMSFNFLADFVVVNSETVKNNCIGFLHVRPAKIVKINNSVYVGSKGFVPDKQQIFKQFGLSEISGPVVSAVGRLNKLKGIHFLIRAAAILKSQGLKATYLIAGKGPDEGEFKSQVGQLGMTDSIKFLGHVSKVDELLAVTDIFALPTLSEGCSNAVLEAMAKGLAVVTTSIPANSEIIEHNETGILVKPVDPDALAKGIRRFIENPSLGKKCGENAKAKMREFDIVETTARYEAFYRQLVSC